MKLKNVRRWSPVPRPKAYLVALLLILIAWFIRYLLHPIVQPFIPFQFFFLACLLTEFLVGLGPALLATALSVVLALYFFVEPYQEWGHISRSDVVMSCNYIAATLLAIVLIEYLQRALYQSRLWSRVAESRYLTSMRRENDRLWAAKKNAGARKSVAIRDSATSRQERE